MTLHSFDDLALLLDVLNLIRCIEKNEWFISINIKDKKRIYILHVEPQNRFYQKPNRVLRKLGKKIRNKQSVYSYDQKLFMLEIQIRVTLVILKKCLKKTHARFERNFLNFKFPCKNNLFYFFISQLSTGSKNKLTS